MKKNELRIGNLVKLNGEIIKAEQITKKKIGYHKEPRENVMHYARLWEIEPIELTEEVLLKIGFEDRKEYFNYIEVFGDDGDYCDSIYICYIPRLNHFKFTHNIVEKLDLQTMDLYNIKYLHQLQNAYYCLINEELEIEL